MNARAAEDKRTAQAVADALNLAPHPEGGRYRQTRHQDAPDGGRGLSSAIYYLLAAGETSHWHRFDAEEIWHFYAGAPLLLTISDDGCEAREMRLGPDVTCGEYPQAIVPAGAWQTARSLGAWTLVGCTSAPAFDFAGWELAAPDWRPG